MTFSPFHFLKRLLLPTTLDGCGNNSATKHRLIVAETAPLISVTIKHYYHSQEILPPPSNHLLSVFNYQFSIINYLTHNLGIH